MVSAAAAAAGAVGSGGGDRGLLGALGGNGPSAEIRRFVGEMLEMGQNRRENAGNGLKRQEKCWKWVDPRGKQQDTG